MSLQIDYPNKKRYLQVKNDIISRLNQQTYPPPEDVPLKRVIPQNDLTRKVNFTMPIVSIS